MLSARCELCPSSGRELAGIGTNWLRHQPQQNRRALPPKGAFPSAGKTAILKSNEIEIVGRGEITVVGVPLGTDEYEIDCVVKALRDGGADYLARQVASSRTNNHGRTLMFLVLEPDTIRTSHERWNECGHRYISSKTRKRA